MLKRTVVLACALALAATLAAAQDAPPPMGPQLYIPAPEPLDPAAYGDHVAFEAAFFAAVAGDDGVLTLAELQALLPPPGEMPPPGEEPPPPPEGGMPPPKPGMVTPLPSDFVAPPPEEGPEALLQAMFAAVAGDDLELTLEEFQGALPDPEMWPPMPPAGEEGAPPPEGTGDEGTPPPEGSGESGGPPPEGTGDEGAPLPEGTGDEGTPPPEGTGDTGMMPPPGLFIPAPEPMNPADYPDHVAFESALFNSVAGDDGVLTLAELQALLPPPGEAPPPPPPPEEGAPMAMPGMMVPLPAGFVPPPPPADFLEAAFAALAGGDLEMTKDEFLAALPDPEAWAVGPPPEPASEGGSPEGGTMNVPPECTSELFTSEMGPQQTNVPCGSQEGNEVFRTVCNTTGFNSQAISLPAGRMASCFGIEAMTPNLVVFTIYAEADPGGAIYDTRRDGLENIGNVALVADAGDAVYRIELDMAESDPGARVTVRFNDHPIGE
ncbi:MAG: hypothetical protein AB1505_17725 [Candidatus Latescibacterota bacterium]